MEEADGRGVAVMILWRSPRSYSSIFRASGTVYVRSVPEYYKSRSA